MRCHERQKDKKKNPGTAIPGFSKKDCAITLSD